MRIFAFDLKRQRNGLVITGLMTQETQKSMLSRRTADFETPLNTSQESNNAGWEMSNPLREPKGTNLETLVQIQFPRPSQKMATQIKVVKKGTRQGCVNTKVW